MGLTNEKDLKTLKMIFHAAGVGGKKSATAGKLFSQEAILLGFHTVLGNLTSEDHGNGDDPFFESSHTRRYRKLTHTAKSEKW